MMKRKFTYFILLLLCQVAAWADPQGSGTATDPYQITSASELKWFSDKVSDTTNPRYDLCAKLINDITCSSTWIPIACPNVSGISTYAFKGTFDGNGKTITGLSTDYSSASSDFPTAFIGSLGTNGVVKNLIIRGCTFKGKTYVGGICAYNNGGTIQNCAAQNVTVWSTSGTGYAGGICGYMGGNSNTHLWNCYCNSCGWSKDLPTQCGSILGYGESNVSISNCYSKVQKTHNGVTGVNVVGEITKEQFESGEIAYKLNVNSSANEWTQEINQDSVPCFGSKSVYYYPGASVSEADLAAGAYATRWYPVDFTLTNAKAYTVATQQGSNVLKLTEFSGPDKNVPLLIYNNTSSEGKITLPKYDAFYSNVNRKTPSNSLLQGAIKGDVTDFSSSNCYLLETHNVSSKNVTAFYKMTTSTSSTSKYTWNVDYRCYLQLPQSGNAKSSFTFVFADDPTGINTTDADGNVNDNTGEVYNIMGQKVPAADMHSGLYIINHKKVLRR